MTESRHTQWRARVEKIDDFYTRWARNLVGETPCDNCGVTYPCPCAATDPAWPFAESPRQWLDRYWGDRSADTDQAADGPNSPS